MKVKEIQELLKSGANLMVRLTDELWDESWGQKGMIAQIKSCVEKNNTFVIKFDYSIAKEHNLKLELHNYYIYKDGVDTGKLGTAAESGVKEEDYIQEEIYFEENDNVPVELANDNSSLREYMQYLKDNNGGQYIQTYVEWLEDYIAVLKISLEKQEKTI